MAEVFSCEFCKISKNFSYRTPLVAASEKSNSIFLLMKNCKFLNAVFFFFVFFFVFVFSSQFSQILFANQFRHEDCKAPNTFLNALLNVSQHRLSFWQAIAVFHKVLLYESLACPKSSFSCFEIWHMALQMMMNDDELYCGMADRRKAFSLVPSRDHCQRSHDRDRGCDFDCCNSWQSSKLIKITLVVIIVTI